jgi:hypothetical protein
MMCPSIVIQDTVSHTGERSTIAADGAACRINAPTGQPRSPIGLRDNFHDRRIAQELAVREEQVAAAVALLGDGATVRVKVLEVDLARKRIALTLRLDDKVGPRADRAAPRTDGGRPPPRVPSLNAAPQRREEQGGGAPADRLVRNESSSLSRMAWTLIGHTLLAWRLITGA